MELDEFGREIPFGSDPAERWRYSKSQQLYQHHHSSYSSERQHDLLHDSLRSSKPPRKSFNDESRHISGRERSWSPDCQRPHERRRDRKERGMTISDTFKEESQLSKYAQVPLLCERLWQYHKTILDTSRIRDKSFEDASSEELDRSSSYTLYAHNYCLKYAKRFFEHHREESWFRQLYSPLEYKRATHKFLEMAKNEAGYMMQEVTELGSTFIIHARLGSGIKSNIGSSTISSSREVNIQKKRTHDELLGKPSSSSYSSSLSSSDRLNSIPLSHVHHVLKKMAILKIVQVPSHVSDLQILRALNELAHFSDNSSSIIKVISSPVANGIFGISATIAATMNEPWLSGLATARENLSGSATAYLDEIAKSNGASLLAAWANTSTYNKTRGSDTFMYRTCWAILPTLESKNKLIQTLVKMNDDTESSDERLEEDARKNCYSISKREGTYKFLKLFIDCSDPYGRLEIDADGLGGNTTTENGSTIEKSAITERKCTILVCNDGMAPQQISISVLSAAISSSKRIQKDKESAISIASALDNLRRIPHGTRIEDLISKVLELQPIDLSLSEEDRSLMQQQSAEDILDITVAYLRRVHLLSFYNCCKLSDNFGAALGTNHPVGTIYLRLKGADDILEKVDENNESGFKKSDEFLANEDKESSTHPRTDTEPTMDTNLNKDMLVRLLDQSLDRALECSKSILAKESSDHVLNKELCTAADEIELMEEQTKVSWVHNHCLLDGDGRARCTFHFCRKLFKDKSFLEKHLIKKHDSYLEAELSKCHDTYIMKVWEEGTSRPIPPILIDCGTKFGFKPCVMRLTEGQYTIYDPEPELVRIAEERRQLELQREADEIRRREHYFRLNEERRNRKPFSENIVDGNANVVDSVGNETNPVFPDKKSSFIDVDDMKDEKVKLSFENVDVSKVTAKTTKKKKKLL